MRLMRDGVSAHFSRDVRDILNNTYHNRRMGRGGPTAWPSRSHDLDPITFYFWGLLKAVGYLAPVHSVDTSPAHCKCLSECPKLFRDLWTGLTTHDKTCPSTYWNRRRTFWALLVTASFQCSNSEIKRLGVHVYTSPIFFFGMWRSSPEFGWLHTHTNIGRTTSVQFMSHQVVEYKVLAFIRDDMRHLPYDSRRAVVTYES
jgi:hypothetical protein